MSTATAERISLEIRAEGRLGTICRIGPCALCDRTFEEQTGQARLVARDRTGKRLGLVCPRCASTDQDTLQEQVLSRAERLKQRAEELEQWAEERVKIHPAAPRAATARITRRGVL